MLGLALMASGAGVLVALRREILRELRPPRSGPVRAVGRAPVPSPTVVLGRASAPAAPVQQPHWTGEPSNRP